MELNDLVKWLPEGFLTVGGGVVGYFTKRNREEIQEMRTAIKETRERLHETDVNLAKNYVPNESLQKALDRLHDCMDNIQNDIKTLIGRVGK